MATNRPTLSITGEKQHNVKSAVAGKSKASKARSRNETYAEKLDNSVSLSSKRKIESILSDVNNLGDVEKMLLYLRLPTGFSESDVSNFTKSSPSGPNSSREEHTKAFNWIRSHLEESPDTSMPKQDVYEEYKNYCDSFTLSAVCAADFGKIMKGVFPKMKRRRLGTRGNSRYCYSGIRKKAEMKSPVLPHLDLSSAVKPCHLCPDHQLMRAAAEVLCSWEKKSHHRDFGDIIQCAQFLIQEGHIPKESEPAKVFISAVEESGKTLNLSRLEQNQDAWGQRSPEERRRETHHQLQMKLQQKQMEKNMRKEEEERKKNFGVQVTDAGIENSYGNCEIGQSKEAVDLNGEVSNSGGVSEGGGNLVSPTPGTSNASNSKESPKKKLTPIQPKTVRNFHLIPMPIPPTADNQPLKLVYIPNSGHQFAVPANCNIPGTQPLPGNPQAIISAQACQNAMTIRNKVIVPASQVIQTSTTKPNQTSVQNSNGGGDQPRTTISLQGAKVNPISGSQVLAVKNSWPKQSNSGGQGITFTLGDATNIPVLQTSQPGIQGSIIPTESSNQNAIVTNQTLQGIHSNQKQAAVILSGNNQGGLFPVQPSTVTGDVTTSPEANLVTGTNAVSKEMVVVPTTNQLSSNIPHNAVEVLISQNNFGQCDVQQKYIVPSTVQMTTVSSRQNTQTTATSITNVANLEAILNPSGPSQKDPNPSNLETNIAVSSVSPQDQFRSMASRGNSLSSALTFPISSITPLTHSAEEATDQRASLLLKTFSENLKGNTSKNADGVKDTQPKQTEKEGKHSRLLEELLRDGTPTLTPAKLAKANATRRNSQTRPKSVAAGVLESKATVNIPLNNESSVSENIAAQGVADVSLYPSLSINKPKNTSKMQTVSGMSAAMMLPPEFRTKIEPVDGHGKGESAAVVQQQPGGNQVRMAFPQGITLIAQEGNGGLSSGIVMTMPANGNPQSQQLFSLLPSTGITVPTSQVAVGSPAATSGQISSRASTPLVNLGSPEAVNSRSSNNTPMSDMGSVPVSPAQPQQAHVFFVPINQGQGLDPSLISVNNKSPVKPKNVPGFFPANQNHPVLVAPTSEAGTPPDLTLHKNVIQQQSQIPLNRKRNHSGGLLIKSSSKDLSYKQSTLKQLHQQQQQQQQQQQHLSIISKFNTKTDMPPPLAFPHNLSSSAHLRGGKPPTLAGRVAAGRNRVVQRKRNVSGPSVSARATQLHAELQQADLNIPTTSSSALSSTEAERLRNLANRSQSVPLPEMSESLQNFIISTNKGCTPTATVPEEIEKSLKLETVLPRDLHVSFDRNLKAKRNLTSELEGMSNEQDQSDVWNQYFQGIPARDENENRSTHLVGSTGSGNCASSQAEIVPNPDLDPWSEGQPLAQDVTSLEDNNSNSSLELQAYTLDNFSGPPSLDLMSNLPASL